MGYAAKLDLFLRSGKPFFNEKMVRTAGLEPATFSSGNYCSIQLSYAREGFEVSARAGIPQAL